MPWSGRPQDAAGVARPAYITAQGRDLRIDLLRGFFVLAMIVDHVRGASPLYLLTGGNRFFVSAAEGFILLSGLMAGLIYRRVVAHDGIVAAVRKVWARALTLYLLTVGITLVLLPISEVAGLPWAQGVNLSHPLALVVSVLTLHRTYYLADVLLLYTLLFAVMPAALFLMADGKTWLLVGISWLVWGLHQLFPELRRRQPGRSPATACSRFRRGNCCSFAHWRSAITAIAFHRSVDAARGVCRSVQASLSSAWLRCLPC